MQQNPGGSSSGSAVGVAAGFSPLSIGRETDGSLLTPGGRSSLYALKLTVGNFAADGIFRLTKTSDSIGGMAKCSADLTILTRILLSTSPADHAHPDLENVQKMQFKDFTIGFVDPEVWRLPNSLLDPTEEYKKQTVSASAQSHIMTNASLSARGLSQSAIDIVKSHGGKVVTQVEVTPASKITYEGQSGYGILRSMTFSTFQRAFFLMCNRCRVSPAT